MAEGVFRQIVKDAGLEKQIHIDSAGTSSYHIGESAHRGTLQTLKKHQIPYDGRARQLAKEDFAKYDYILAMDRSNFSTIRARIPENSAAKVALLLDYAEGIAEKEVPDPYYDGRFEEVYQLVSNGARNLLAAIREEHGL